MQLCSQTHLVYIHGQPPLLVMGRASLRPRRGGRVGLSSPLGITVVVILLLLGSVGRPAGVRAQQPESLDIEQVRYDDEYEFEYQQRSDRQNFKYDRLTAQQSSHLYTRSYFVYYVSVRVVLEHHDKNNSPQVPRLCFNEVPRSTTAVAMRYGARMLQSTSIDELQAHPHRDGAGRGDFHSEVQLVLQVEPLSSL